MSKTPKEYIDFAIQELLLDGQDAHYFRLGAESICKYFGLDE